MKKLLYAVLLLMSVDLFAQSDSQLDLDKCQYIQENTKVVDVTDKTCSTNGKRLCILQASCPEMKTLEAGTTSPVKVESGKAHLVQMKNINAACLIGRNEACPTQPKDCISKAFTMKSQSVISPSANPMASSNADLLNLNNQVGGSCAYDSSGGWPVVYSANNLCADNSQNHQWICQFSADCKNVHGVTGQCFVSDGLCPKDPLECKVKQGLLKDFNEYDSRNPPAAATNAPAPSPAPEPATR
jgi:hypothetical protein